MKRQALGKGLSSLIPETSHTADAGLLLLEVKRIQPNRYQPRVDFGRLDGLVDSIRENGIVQPVIVRQEEDGYRLIAGERRWRAAQIAGVEKIPAIVKKISDDRLLQIALIENIQRKELNPIEEARAYEVLLTDLNLSHAEVAKRVGRDRSSVSNSLRLLKLHDKIQAHIREGTVSVGHAKAIMAIPDAETQIRVAEEVVTNLLSVRETEERVASLLEQAGKKSTRAPQTTAVADDPNVSAASERLTRALATKVRIIKKGERGKVEIEFYSEEELQRLYEFLLTAEKGH
ncbi:MAG TPA: ParB/RepB/Spo0J family partition protein [Candidatus Polarisedimenticolia bacterium]|nr:ParB/RepB/Spo0J family partition protein [Candidatus Polarisedimenticolia bacterium]